MNHESVHILQNRIFGNYFVESYAGWMLLFSPCGLSMTKQGFNDFEDLAYFNNPWEIWAYEANNSGARSDGAHGPSLLLFHRTRPMNGFRPVLCVAVVSALAACDPVFNVCGQVKSCEDGRGLAGAKVTYTGRELTLEGWTGTDGRFCLEEMGYVAKSYTMIYEKAGYQPEKTSHARMDESTERLAPVCLEALPCAPGDIQSCACPDGGEATRLCQESGTEFGECGPCSLDMDAALPDGGGSRGEGRR